MIRLGVNIDHVATLRNARGEFHPDPIEAAKFVKRSGANSITIHLREDRRHIKDLDAKNICLIPNLAVNLEISTNIEIVNTLPIENISRKLPKTGYYKKTPYFGTWEERVKLTNTFNMAIDKICIENNWKAFKWPSKFLNDLGELDFEYMERPKSVHLSPMSYRWDLFNNSLNSLHNQ